MRLSLCKIISDQRSKQAPVTKLDLTGKTVMVTGANTGLGFEAAKHFATMNPERLILACRNMEKGKNAANRISNETGYTKTQVWQLDLSTFASVRAFADKFEKEGGRLDVLVANAAIAAGPKYEKTDDGFLSIFQVNVISTALHTLLMVPHMIRTAEEHNTKPRIVIVASDVHYWASLDDKGKPFVSQPKIFDALSSVEYFKKVPHETHYSDSKLLDVLFARALQAHLANHPSIIVDSVNPGYCYSELRRSFSGIRASLDSLMEKALALTTEEGSRQLVWAALGGTGDAALEEKLKGAYVSFTKVQEPSDFSISQDGLQLQDRVWNELMSITQGADSRITQIIERDLQH